MKLAPIDVSHKSFKRKAFGYDAEEVSEFLKVVANEMEELIREKNRLKEETREQEMQLAEYKDRDRVLRDTITTAHNMSEKVREDSEREAKIILNDANQKADMIVRDARDSLKRVYQEINDIKRSKVQFESNLRALVQSHLGLLDSNKDAFKGLDYTMKFDSQETSVNLNQNAARNSDRGTTSSNETRLNSSTSVSPVSS